MTASQRPFNPEALLKHAVPEIQPRIGVGARVWRYSVLVPVEEVHAGGSPRLIATDDDLQSLELTLVRHFGGVTTPVTVPGVAGFGVRDPRKPKETLELNRHACFVVYAAALRASDDYFLALQRELQQALGEGVILVERQDVTIL